MLAGPEEGPLLKVFKCSLSRISGSNSQDVQRTTPDLYLLCKRGEIEEPETNYLHVQQLTQLAWRKWVITALDATGLSIQRAKNECGHTEVNKLFETHWYKVARILLVQNFWVSPNGDTSFSWTINHLVCVFLAAAAAAAVVAVFLILKA